MKTIDNPNYRFKDLDDIDLFRKCYLGVLTNSYFEDFHFNKNSNW